MHADIMIIIAITAVIQSLFGAGILLFGTTLLLLLDYPFIDVLTLLLPVSLAVNLMQIFQHHSHIDFNFYRKVLLLSMPPISVFLFLITHVRFNIGLIIGPFLLLIAAKEFSVAANRAINRLMQNQSIYFVMMGVVHGISNLGGSLLTAIVHHHNYPKDMARATVAACYSTFACVQLLTLWLFEQEQINLASNESLIYMTVAVLIFGLTNETVYSQINKEKYQRIFAIFLAASGIILLSKSLSA
ncbi:MAG: hypothetical protein CTY19_18370 [Methylomonas sp.]|jgi:hypothetical protein|nr:MAG: hypothetical protein CTY19_18370 [Methylomonas sp.]